MLSIDEPQGVVVTDAAPDPTVEALTLPSVVGEAMIERAKSVVVVAQRVDDDEAAEILLDAARRAEIPVRLAADQVMSALETEVEDEGITQETLARALAAVRPVDQPEDAEPADDMPRPDGRAA